MLNDVSDMAIALARRNVYLSEDGKTLYVFGAELGVVPKDEAEFLAWVQRWQHYLARSYDEVWVTSEKSERASLAAQIALIVPTLGVYEFYLLDNQPSLF